MPGKMPARDRIEIGFRDALSALSRVSLGLLLVFVLGSTLGCLRCEAMATRDVTLYEFESASETDSIAAANPDVSIQASADNASQGERSLRVVLGRARDGGARSRALRIPNPDGCDWSGSGVLCFDLYNPHDEVFAVDLEVFDGQSQGYHRGYWDQRWTLVPGWTHFVIDLGDSFRHGEHRESPMDRADIRSIQLTIRPALFAERELYVDSVRLEAGGDEAAAVGRNQQSLADFWEQRMAAAERSAAETAAASLAAKIELAKQQGVDAIYPEAALFVARLGLDLRSRLSWFSSREEQRAIYDYVRATCARSERELDEIMAGRRPARGLIRHGPGELELRGAYWYAGEEPVLVTAMLYNSSGPLMQFFHPHDVVPCLLTTAGASRYDVERTPLYEAFKKYPETHRVGYDGWCGHLIRDRWSMGGGNEEVVICLESPYMKEAMAKAIRARTPRPEDLPNMLVHVMEGELSYCCYCEYTQEMFCQWLIDRHGSLEAVNEVWGADYTTLDEVRTPHHEDWDGNRACWYDFADFNQHRFTSHHVWAKSIVREVDPVTPVTVGGIYYTFSGRQGLLGVDNEAWIDAMCEAGEAEAFGPGTMPTDFLWAVCDGRKPIIDLEYHSDIFNWWGNFLHGYAILAMWWWPGPDTMDMLDTSVPHSPYIPLSEVEKLVVNALDIQRLSRYIIAFPAVRSPFAILYSRSSLLQAPPDSPRTTPYTADLEQLYDATLPLDAGRTFVTEKDLAEGQAGRFRLIALPSVRYLTPESFDRLLGFVRGGGTLLVTGDSLRADQYARPADYLAQFGLSVAGELPAAEASDAGPERQPFGPGEPGWLPQLDTAAYHLAVDGRLLGKAPRLTVAPPGSAEVVARFEDGEPGLVSIPLGEGRVCYIGARLGKESLLAVVEDLLGDLGVKPIVSVREVDGARPVDVEARAVEYDGDALLYIINPREESLVLRLDTEWTFREIENLRTLDRSDYGGSVTVPPRDTALLRLRAVH